MERKWNYDKGLGRFQTFPQLANFFYLWHKDLTAIKSNEGGGITETTYAQLWTDIRNISSRLTSAKLNGAHVAIIGEISREWISLFFGVTSSGGVVVPLDKDYSAENLAEQAKHADIKVLAIDAKDRKSIEKARELKKLLPGLSLYISFGELDGFENLRGYLNREDSGVEFQDIDPDKTAMMVFTSGTTDISKIVMLSHKNICADVNGCIASMKNDMYPTGVEIPILPPHHMFCLTASVFTQLYYGMTLIMGGGIKQFSENMKRFKPMMMIVVPMIADGLYKRIWSEASKNNKDGLLKKMIRLSNFLRKIKIDLRHVLFKSVIAGFGGKLNIIISGGAFLEPEMVTRFEELGIIFLNGYGITECSPVLSLNPPHAIKLGSVGTAISGCEIKIVNGEICVKGDAVMKGYYKNEKASASAFEDGYFKTGDLGYFDDEGYLFITGRKKNLIILGDGNNICPEELEVPLEKQSLVKSVFVVCDEKNGQSLLTAKIFPDLEHAAEIGVTDVQLALKAQIKKLNLSLPPYKHIKQIEIVSRDFEKTALGKIKRYVNERGDGTYLQV